MTSIRNWACGLLFLACATAPKPAPFPLTSSAPLTTSHLEIVYLLGHDVHRLILDVKEGKAQVSHLHDTVLLGQSPIESKSYLELISKVQTFIKPALGARSPATADSICRSPFVITLKNPDPTETLSGCRSGRLGVEFSRLIRRIEFLMYSKK